MAAIAIAADAGPGVGLGHVARCSAVAVALRARGTPVTCVGLGADAEFHFDGVAWHPERHAKADSGLTLIDSYLRKPDDLPWAAEVLAQFHDVGPVYHRSRLVITSEPGRATDSTFLGGPRYVCLRPPFWGMPERGAAHRDIRKVLVATGAGDPGGLGPGLAELLAEVLPAAEVALVRGPQARWQRLPRTVLVLDSPENLLEPLLSCDLAVTTGGQVLFEALAAGAAVIAMPVAPNQMAAARSVAAAGAAELAHSVEEAGDRAAGLADNPDARSRLTTAGQRLVDGFGAHRVAFALSRLDISRP